MRKVVFLIPIFILSYLVGISQLEKTNWLLGGSASYSHAKYNTEIFNSGQEQYEFRLSPSVGYFFADRFASGIITSFYEVGSRFEDGGPWNKYSDFNFGPFVRYYFLKKESTVNMLAQSYYQFGAEGSGSGINKSTLAFSGGPVIYFNSTVGLELMINYLTYRYKHVNATDKKLLFSLGLQVHLQRDN